MPFFVQSDRHCSQSRESRQHHCGVTPFMDWEGDKCDRYGLLDFFEFKCPQKRESHYKKRDQTPAYSCHVSLSCSSPPIKELRGIRNRVRNDYCKLEPLGSRPLARGLVGAPSNHHSPPSNRRHKSNRSQIAVELRPRPDRVGGSPNTESAIDKATLLHRILAWSFGILLLRSTVIIG